MILYYFIIYVTIIAAMFTSEKKKKAQIIALMFFLTLIAGLRHYTIGSDTISYFRSYKQTLYYGVKIFEHSRFEFGYVLLQYIISRVTSNFNIFLLICTIFMNTSIGIFIYKYSKQPIVSILMFILLRLFFNEMNILREFLAVCIILNSVQYIVDRKIIKFLIVVFIASLFHASALVAVPLYFLYRKEMNFKTKTIIFSATIIIYLFLSNILIYITNKIGMYSNYVENFYGSNKLASLLSVLISACIFIFFKFIYKKFKKNLSIKEIKHYDFLVNISYITLMLDIIAYRISIFSRLINYYGIFKILVLSNVPTIINNRYEKYFCNIIVCTLFFISFIIIMYYRPDWYLVTPYRFFWQ